MTDNFCRQMAPLQVFGVEGLLLREDKGSKSGIESVSFDERAGTLPCCSELIASKVFQPLKHPPELSVHGYVMSSILELGWGKLSLRMSGLRFLHSLALIFD